MYGLSGFAIGIASALSNLFEGAPQLDSYVEIQTIISTVVIDRYTTVNNGNVNYSTDYVKYSYVNFVDQMNFTVSEITPTSTQYGTSEYIFNDSTYSWLIRTTYNNYT